LLRTVAAVNGPVIVAIEQRTPSSIKHKFGFLGGNMVTAMRACGAVGVVSNGPSRDWDEIKPLNFQMLLTGLTPGHGDFVLKAINVDVSIGGMDVSPGEIIHMDCNGAVKFPAKYIEEVNKRVKTIVAIEARRQAMMRATKDPETVIVALSGLYD
jgi:regulator of RNase E activity RraA